MKKSKKHIVPEKIIKKMLDAAVKEINALGPNVEFEVTSLPPKMFLKTTYNDNVEFDCLNCGAVGKGKDFIKEPV